MNETMKSGNVLHILAQLPTHPDGTAVLSEGSRALVGLLIALYRAERGVTLVIGN